MMRDRVRQTVGTLLAAGVVAFATPAAAQAPTSAQGPDQGSRTAAISRAFQWSPGENELTFRVQFVGVGTDGRSQIWISTDGEPTPGFVMLQLSATGAAATARDSVWPVRAIFQFAEPSQSTSFAAELVGSIDWRKRDLSLSGRIVSGPAVGTELLIVGNLDAEFGIAGQMRVLPTASARSPE
jgi:hypothetical protein